MRNSIQTSDALRLVDACCKEHFAAMSKIHALGWRDTYPGYVPDSYMSRVITDDHWVPVFQKACQGNQWHGLLLYSEDVPAGCITFGPTQYQDYQGWGEVLSFYVHPDFRGRGLGSLLFGECLQRLKLYGFSNVFVLVLRENLNARRFYSVHGFQWNGSSVALPFDDAVCIDLRYIRKLS